MAHRDEDGNEDQLGPKESSDDSTMADMGLSGPPAASSTPVGQGDEPGPGASEEQDDSEADHD